jgi:hypothetical protein
MLRKFLLAMALLAMAGGAAQAEPRGTELFTLAATGPVQAGQAEQQNGQTVFGYDTMTVATVTIGAMFGAAVATEIAVIGLGVYGYPAATLWVAGTTSFVSGALGGGALANWILQNSRAPHQSPLERQSQGAAQANARR